MANITKTVQTELAAIAAVVGAAQAISSVLDVSTNLAATILIDHAPASAVAPTKGTEYRIEISEKDAGNDTWRTLTSFVTGLTAAVAKALDGDEAIGQTVIEENATAGLAVGDIVFIVNAALGSSEWAKVVALAANVSFTIQDALTNDQALGAAYYNQCEQFVAVIDLTSIKRLRVVCNNNYLAGTTINIYWRCAAITGDSIG